MARILIVEDEPAMRMGLKDNFEAESYEVEMAVDGQEGLDKVRNGQFDLIVLDVMMPKMSGFDVCKALRKMGIMTPIIFLTAKSEEIDKVLGLELGADDYLTKPFSVRELTARVKAILRRVELFSGPEKEKETEILYFNELVVDKNKRKVMLFDERVDLTPKEFDLLALMASNPGTSYSRERLLKLIWGYEFDGYEHTVNSHINRLETFLCNIISKPKYILTNWGIGYRFNDDLNEEENVKR